MAAGARKALRKGGVDYATLRELALALPDVSDSTTLRGVAFKARGKLLACKAIHRSAEAESLLVRVPALERDRLIAAQPEIYYVTAHYRLNESVLVRLARIDVQSLKALLWVAWQCVTGSTGADKPAKRKKTGSVFRYL